MGRKVIYKCDLCREEKPHTALRTIFHTTTKDGGKYILTEVDVRDPLDKQICCDCIQMIKDA